MEEEKLIISSCMEVSGDFPQQEASNWGIADTM